MNNQKLVLCKTETYTLYKSLNKFPPYIIRQFFEDHIAQSSFNREFNFVSSLNLKGILKLIYREQNKIYYEFFSGSPISSYQKKIYEDIYFFLVISIQLCSALLEIHKYGIIHQHLSPQKILYDELTQIIKIYGFEYAIIQNNNKSNNNTPPNYSYGSPEQLGLLNHPMDQRSDIFSLGLIFYEYLTHQLPQIYNQTPKAPHELEKSIPKTISWIILKMISFDPVDRYQSILGLWDDLHHCQNELDRSNQIPFFFRV